MTQRRMFMLAASGVAMAGLLHIPGTAMAQNYDTSAIATDPALAARLPAKIKTAGVLVIGSDTAYAPWEYLSEIDGQTPEGIDVDIAKAIAATLGVKIDFQTSAFDAILPALGTKYDVGISAFTITNERMAAVNFISYTQSGSLWAVKAGNPSAFDASNICGHVIAIQTGSFHEEMVTADSAACVTAGQKAVELLPFGTQAEALTRVAAGGADATVSGSSIMGYAAKQSGGALETMVPVGKLGENGLNGIAVAKADMEMTQLMADVLNKLIADGHYKALLDAWGVGSAFIDKADINPTVPD